GVLLGILPVRSSRILAASLLGVLASVLSSGRRAFADGTLPPPRRIPHESPPPAPANPPSSWPVSPPPPIPVPNASPSPNPPPPPPPIPLPAPAQPATPAPGLPAPT